MAHPGFKYVPLKVIASIIRFFASWTSTPASPDEKLEIPSRDGTRKIRINVYRSASPRSPSPVLINWHGSGFVLPMHGSDDLFCRQIARETTYTVLDASYALGPEHPFPAAVEDAEDMLNWVLERPQEYDVENVAVSGFSAGGNLALVLASSSEGDGSASRVPQGAVKSVMAFYPVTDLSVNPGEKRAPDGSAGTLPPALARFFNACYIPSSTSPSDPRLSPSKAPAASFPNNVLIVAAGKDNLAPEAEELVRRLKAEKDGVRVTYRLYEKMHHGWDKHVKKGSLEEKNRDKMYWLGCTFLWTRGDPERVSDLREGMDVLKANELTESSEGGV
jgi:acetyl esterase/lipase